MIPTHVSRHNTVSVCEDGPLKTTQWEIEALVDQYESEILDNNRGCK